MEWDRLEAFIAVARAGGFTAAARAAGRTQSAFSQAVMGLEAHLGAQLLTRSRRGAELTEAGRVLLEHAERALAELDAAALQLRAIGDLTTGRLRLGTSDTLGVHLLPPALSAFRTRHPGIEVTLSAAPSPATALSVAEGRLDIGVVSLPLPPATTRAGQPLPQALHTEPLLPQPDVAIAAPHHALAEDDRPLPLSELATLPLLLLGADTAGRHHLDAAFAAAGLRPTVHMQMNSVELLKRLAALDFGVAVVPALSVGTEVQQGTLCARPIDGLHRDDALRQVALVLPARLPLSRAAEAFRAVVRSSLT